MMSRDPVILFDGACNLCNGAVNFVIKRDKAKAFKFAALQSNIGQQILDAQNLPADAFESFILIEKNYCYSKSTAALKVCRYLSGLWPLLYGFIIVPGFIRDGIYKWIAGNRYRWFGRTDRCMIPSDYIKNRFLS